MHSETIGEIASAMAAAQGAMTSAKKDKTNKFTKSRYATLASIQDAIRKPLADNGLSYFQATQIEEGKEILFTMLVHSSGEWYRTENLIPSVTPHKMLSPVQSYGILLTYLKRYQLSALIGVSVADEDSDGQLELQPPSEKSKTDQPQKKSVSKQNTNGKKGYVRNYIDDIFDEIQARTNNYYDNKIHLFKVLLAWPDSNDKEAINQTIIKAIQHVSLKADKEAAQDEQE